MRQLTPEKSFSTSAEGRYDLVKGEYTPDEAYEIIQDLFTKKIQFNGQKRFSNQIRFGKQSPEIDNRIAELKSAQKKAKEIIANAKQSGKTVRISSSLFLELI